MQNTLIVSSKEMRQVCDHLQKQGIFYIAGINSISVPSTQTKYFDKSVVKPWPDLEGQRRDMTPGQAARTELSRRFPDLKKVGWPGKAFSLLDKRPPMHYSGEAFGQMTMIDLSSAYWQLYRCLWLDVCYPRGYGGRYPLLDVAHELRDWKAARNAVIGLTRSTRIVGIKGSNRSYMAIKNKFLSPPLWATIQDLLHWIATEAMSYGAIYINTDGYIFPSHEYDREIEMFRVFLSSHNLAYDVRATGDGEIISWSNYRIGHFATKPYRLNLTYKSRSFSNVVETNGEWSKYWLHSQKFI